MKDKIIVLRFRVENTKQEQFLEDMDFYMQDKGFIFIGGITEMGKIPICYVHGEYNKDVIK